MRTSWLACVFASAVALSQGLHAELSAPPKHFFDADDARKAPVTLKAAVVTPAVTVDVRLNPPAQAQVQALRQTNASGLEKALQIGFGRDVDFDSNALAWQLAPDGGRVARVSLTSPGAAALRMAFVFEEFAIGAELRFFGSSDPTRVYGPIRRENARLSDGIYWSPVMEGQTLTAEIYLAPGLGPDALRFRVPSVSHLVATAATALTAKALSEPCERDVACLVNPPQGLLDAAKAVARMVYTKGGKSYLCTGTLLADTDHNTANPYFYTASHCINRQIVASTLNTFWFYETVTCGGNSAPNLQQRAGGATLLYSDDGTDATLLKLDEAPPSGVVFAGWDAAQIAAGSAVVGIHHPQGDFKKESEGVLSNYGPDGNGLGSFINVLWSKGSTEKGSSGSGLFVANGANYYLRGGLYGGGASCATPQFTDSFSRLDLVFPQIKKYLDPVTEKVTVVEFYNGSLDHYFITWIGEEIEQLDSGDTPGWKRTGHSFQAYPAQASGTSAVCRIYIPPEKGDSHFFGRDKAECDATIARNPSFIVEDLKFFYVLPTSGGTCATGLTPVYRVYSNRADANHRYLTSRSERDAMVAKGWVAEGDGPDKIVMCAP